MSAASLMTYPRTMTVDGTDFTVTTDMARVIEFVVFFRFNFVEASKTCSCGELHDMSTPGLIRLAWEALGLDRNHDGKGFDAVWSLLQVAYVTQTIDSEVEDTEFAVRVADLTIGVEAAPDEHNFSLVWEWIHEDTPGEEYGLHASGSAYGSNQTHYARANSPSPN